LSYFILVNDCTSKCFSVIFPGIFYDSSISVIRHRPGSGRDDLSSFYCISKLRNKSTEYFILSILNYHLIMLYFLFRQRWRSRSNVNAPRITTLIMLTNSLFAMFVFLFFSNTILFLFVIDTDCEKQLISPLGFVKFFRPPHC
jgi:hypothetical protein